MFLMLKVIESAEATAFTSVSAVLTLCASTVTSSPESASCERLSSTRKLLMPSFRAKGSARVRVTGSSLTAWLPSPSGSVTF